MTMRKVRWGILSTANIGITQVIPALKRSGIVDVAAIASESGRAQQAAADLNIPIAYDSYEELLRDENIDAVYIPLPNHLHKESVIKAAESGKHILCEKPAALTVDDTEQMIQVCRKNNVKFMEAFMYQFHPQHDRVREIIASGEIGKIKHMKASFSFYMTERENNIRMKKHMGGGSLYDVGCYCIHAIRNILQSEPVQIRVSAEIDPITGVDISAYGYMELENGVRATFDSSFDMTFRHEYEVIGESGRIIIPRAFRPDVNNGEGLILISNDRGERKERIQGDSYLLQVDHFSQCILENKEPSYTAENTIKNMKVIEDCYSLIEHPTNR
jgi:D-xylose 1-dehydrogenase (NADP+, D-xylono-1,5-lactone-forming)